jgi:hypothetical protein
MRTLLYFLVSGLCCTFCWGQGKLQFSADSVHLVYFDASCGPLAGEAVSSANIPAGFALVADLYAGSTASSLALVTTATFTSPLPGRWNPLNVALPLSGLTNAWFQVQVRDAAFSNATAAASAGSFAGYSQVFSAVPGVSIVYRPIYQASAPVLSTWQPGTYTLDSVAVGSMGAIAVGLGEIGPPKVSVSPTNKIVPIGATVTFQAQATGFPPLTYQWLFGTNELGGETNSVLTFTNAQSTQSGQYRVLVTNPAGSTTSDPATLSVLATLDVHMVPAISLFGTVGLTYRLQYINIGGPTTEWTDLATVTITNTGQLYFDLTANGQPTRFYRLVQVP